MSFQTIFAYLDTFTKPIFPLKAGLRIGSFPFSIKVLKSFMRLHEKNDCLAYSYLKHKVRKGLSPLIKETGGWDSLHLRQNKRAMIQYDTRGPF